MGTSKASEWAAYGIVLEDVILATCQYSTPMITSLGTKYREQCTALVSEGTIYCKAHQPPPVQLELLRGEYGKATVFEDAGTIRRNNSGRELCAERE